MNSARILNSGHGSDITKHINLNLGAIVAGNKSEVNQEISIPQILSSRPQMV